MAACINIHARKCPQGCFKFVILVFITSCLAYGSEASEVRRLTIGTQKYHCVALGGWLVIEGWIKPSLFDGIPDNDLLDGTQIQLKSMKLGTYIVAENGGGQKVAVNRTNPLKWETFRVWRVRDGYYQLRVFNKQFLGADNGGGGVVKAVATTPRSWETFQIIRNNADRNLVHLKALNGMYLQANSKDQLTADFKGEPAWDDNNAATFEMSFTGHMQGEFQISNGYGHERAAQVLKEHRSTFIREDDFVFLSKQGISAVRIPVGWWIASDPKPPAPFVGGSLECLDKAFSWLMSNVGCDALGLEVQVTKKRKERVHNRDPSAPRLSKNGYKFFYVEQCSRLKKTYAQTDREIVKTVNDLWNKLSDNEKMQYIERSQQDKKRSKTQMMAYKERIKLQERSEGYNGDKTSEVVGQKIEGNVTVPFFHDNSYDYHVSLEAGADANSFHSHQQRGISSEVSGIPVADHGAYSGEGDKSVYSVCFPPPEISAPNFGGSSLPQTYVGSSDQFFYQTQSSAFQSSFMPYSMTPDQIYWMQGGQSFNSQDGQTLSLYPQNPFI